MSNLPSHASSSIENPGIWRLAKGDWILLVLTTIIAALVRFDFLYATNFGIDADEAIVGLMAKHILEGAAMPVFYYGQHYMGSLEAILVSCMFWMFGPSNWALQSVPLLVSVAITPIVFFLTRELGGRASAHMSSFLYSLPPAALLVWSSKARGGFIEVLFLGALAFLYTCRWIRAEQPRLLLVVKIAFLLGVGWWVNNQILYFMLSIALCMTLRGLQGVLEEGILQRKLAMMLSFLQQATVGIVTFFLGSSPYWIYNYQNDFPSLGMFGIASGREVLHHLEGLFSTALPILLGGKRFWDSSLAFSLGAVVYLCVYGGLLLLFLAWRKKAIFGLCKGSIERERPVEMLLVFIVVSCSIFAVSTFGWLVQAPRYLLPVYIGLYPLLGLLLEQIGLTSRRMALGIALLLVAMSIFPAYYPTRAIQGEPVVFKEDRVEKDHGPIIKRLHELGIRRIRTDYWIGYRIAFETQEAITFVVFQEPKTIRIHAYEADVSSDERDSIPLVLVPSEANIVRVGIEKLGYLFKEERIGGYVLLHSLVRDESGLQPVATGAYSITSNFGALPTSNMSDGSLSTRWGTGTPQRSGQKLRFEFHQPVDVVGIQLVGGDWAHDYPRSLSIRIETVEGHEVEVVSPKDYYAVKYFVADNGEVKVVFTPARARAVTVEQLGRDPVLDWSVAEARLFARNSQHAAGSEHHESN